MRSVLLPLFLCAIGLPLRAGGLPSGPPASADDDRPSLEQLLEALRAERERMFEARRAEIEAAILRFEEHSNQSRTSLAAVTRKTLIEFGSEFAPLMVPFLEPGAEARKAQLFRGEQVSLVLVELASPAIEEPLMNLARSGSSHGRRNAVLALGALADQPRVAALLRELYSNGSGPVRAAALAGLARAGGGTSDALFAQALRDSDKDIVRTALESLAQAGNRELAPRVLEFVLEGDADEHLEAILDYYFAAPELITKGTEHIVALAGLTRQRGLSTREKIVLLDRLRHFDFKVGRQLREALEPLESSPSEDLRDASLILLASKGDKGARRSLLKRADEYVRANASWPQAYNARAEVYYKIGDYDGALKDYKKARKLQGTRNVDLSADLGMARCYALKGRFKDAADVLNRAPISLRDLKALASDPDFSEMVEDEDYRRVFRLDPR